jgi:hypothetical protein
MPSLGGRLKYGPDGRVIAINSGWASRFAVRFVRDFQKLDGIGDMDGCDLAETQVPYLVFPPVNMAFPHPPRFELRKLLLAVSFYGLGYSMD